MNDTRRWLDEVKARCEKATPGPWTADVVGNYARVPETEADGDEGVNDTFLTAENALFIANARSDIPRLVALVERLLDRKLEI